MESKREHNERKRKERARRREFNKTKKGKPRKVVQSDLDPRYPWERQPGEPPKAYLAFEHYLTTAPSWDRNHRGTAAAVGRSKSQIYRWSDAHDWKRRVEAYDRVQAKNRIREHNEKIADMHKRQAQHAVAGQVAAMNTLKQYLRTDDNHNPLKMTARDATRLFDVMARIEMRAMGEPDTLHETKGKIEVTANATVNDTRGDLVKLLEDPKALRHMAALSKLMGTDGSEEK